VLFPQYFSRGALFSVRPFILAASRDSRALELRPEAVPAPRTEDTVLDKRRPRGRPPAWWALVAGGVAGVVAAGVIITVLVRRGEAGGPTCDDTTRNGCAARCAANDAAACYLLARTLHGNAVGIPVDHEAARVADTKACRLRDDRGCVAGAKSLIAVADKVPADDARRPPLLEDAVLLLSAACERGTAEACRLLGREYSKGFGHLLPDPPRAFVLVEKACEGNDVVACRALEAMILDPNNGATPELRAGARRVHDAACARALPELTCSR